MTFVMPNYMHFSMLSHNATLLITPELIYNDPELVQNGCLPDAWQHDHASAYVNNPHTAPAQSPPQTTMLHTLQ